MQNLPYYLLLLDDLVVGLPRATHGWALPTFSGRYLAAMERLLCQNPDDLISSRDMFAKKACTVANFLRSWALAYIFGWESLTTRLMS